MRNIYLLALIHFVTFQNAECQDKKGFSYLKNLKFMPVTEDYLFIHETEVSNRQYHEFLDWTLKNKGLKAYHDMHPDTTVWRDKNVSSVPFVQHYFQHPAYYNFPVVGVSWYQAMAYCNWKAEKIMESKEFNKTNLKKIQLRLPSEQEWMKAARGGLSDDAIYPWNGNQIRFTDGKKKDIGKCRLNVKRDNVLYEPSPWTEGGFITTEVESYWPNNIGLYNICGNVAEWIEEKNKAKGGSWDSYPYNARIDIAPESVTDSMSTRTIGFRPVLEIISYKTGPYNSSYTLTAKMLEKQVKKVSDSLSAAIYETSNLLYDLFLDETKNSTDTVRSEGWKEYSRYLYYRQYNLNSKFNYYPVVNISYESAVHFCEWLTKRYNQSEHRAYKEVVFRLPTIKEWELAAKGGIQNTTFPWSGPYCRNNRGCYLANFNPLEEQYYYQDPNGKKYYDYPNNDSTISRGADGVVYTGIIDNYCPNGIGLYQCAGNVAEMTAEKGISKGGSWTSSQYYLQIESKETYTGSNASLGFRFFMEVRQY